MPRVHQIERERMVVDSPTAERRAALLVASIISYVLGVVELFLTFRFLLLLFGANGSNAFVNIIYSLTDPLVAPFRGIFSNAVQGIAVFDWSTILAMIVYAVIAYVIIGLIAPERPEYDDFL